MPEPGKARKSIDLGVNLSSQFDKSRQLILLLFSDLHEEADLKL